MPKFIVTVIDRYEVEKDNLEEVQEMYFNGDFCNMEFLDGIAEYTKVEEETKPCISEGCDEQLDKDIWKEELGMCVECSNAYYSQLDEKGEN